MSLTDPPHLPGQVRAERFHLSIPSLPEWIEPTVDYLRQKAVLAGACREDGTGKLLIALHEAMTNAVIHGNLGVSSELKEQADDAFARALAQRVADPLLSARPVEVDVDYDGTCCRWTITDQGQGFDVAHVLARCLSDDPEVQLASGRGILMMQSFLDEVRYELGGRRIVLTLHRPSGPERRHGPRTSLHLPLQVAPLRPDGTPDWDAAYEAVSRDLSAGGVALWQAGLAPSERVMIAVTRGAQVTYVPAEVRHCRPLGDGSVELGCRFLVEPAGPVAGAAGQLREVQQAIASLLDQPVPEQERRAHLRVAFNERVDILVEGQAEPLVVFARDLSRGGIAFIARASVSGDITVILPSPAAQPTLRIRARVVRCVKVAEGFFDIGACFLRMD